MLNESLPEMLLVAKYCIQFRKDIKIWPAQGCYGFPAALLLFSIVDSIGSYIEKGSVKNHFNILNNPIYYGLKLEEKDIRIVYEFYRNLLSHHSVIAKNAWLDIGKEKDSIFSFKNNIYLCNLLPFYNVSVKVVQTFLDNPSVLNNNQTIKYIHEKR